MRRQMQVLLLALCVPFGLVISCNLSSEKAEHEKAPKVVSAPTSAYSMKEVELDLQINCLKILMVFQDSELLALKMKEAGLSSDDSRVREVYSNLEKSSGALATTCNESIRGLYERSSGLESAHDDALYFSKYKRIRIQNKTPPKRSSSEG